MNKLVVLMGLLAGTATAATMSTLTETDKTFISKAGMGNQFEIEAAKLAQTQSTDPAVKAYALKMIADHTKLAASLTTAVKRADPSMTVPTDVSAAQQKMLDVLKAAGKNFDALYKKDMTTSHAETYTLFQTYTASKVANIDLKGVVKAALPTVKGHLDMAKGLPAMNM